ncbi:MAG TPA: methyltransferase domain-containing protein [Alphaproteobacteria bacterium]|nr:methyltransferase domain-containing protein [Alphaproteobacteria bacterium]HJN61470.1 methyltransferase domain-containing protein [Alphaproteobacteria bacterium]
MTFRALIKRSVALTCAYYLHDDWRARRRLAAGRLETGSGARHYGLDIAASLRYVERVYGDYLAYGGVTHFSGSVAEIGPGDSFAVALRILGAGAGHVHAIDRWVSRRDAEAQRRIYSALSERHGLGHLFEGVPAEETIKNLTYHAGEPAEAFFHDSGLRFDAILSRAVMEHLYDPLAALDGMERSLKPGGIMIHRIDLRDHGMFSGHHPLTLLTVGDGLHRRMTRGAGRPNRVLIGAYREWLQHSGMSGGITISRLAGVSEEFDPAAWAQLDNGAKLRALECVRAIRPRLSEKFKAMADEDLAVAGLVLVARRSSA